MQSYSGSSGILGNRTPGLVTVAALALHLQAFVNILLAVSPSPSRMPQEQPTNKYDSQNENPSQACTGTASLWTVRLHLACAYASVTAVPVPEPVATLLRVPA